MKTLHVALLAVALVILGSGISYYLISSYHEVDVQEVPIFIEVGSYVGMNLDNDALHLGTVLPGGYARRNLTITNRYDFPVRVEIQVLGEVSGSTLLSENGFVLPSGQSKDVIFTVSAPSTKGNYSGTAKVFLTRI